MSGRFPSTPLSARAYEFGKQTREFAGKHRGKLIGAGAAVGAGYGIGKEIGRTVSEKEEEAKYLISSHNIVDSEKIALFNAYFKPYMALFHEEILRDLKHRVQENINNLNENLSFLDTGAALASYKAYLQLTEYTLDTYGNEYTEEQYEDSINKKLNEKKESIKADKKRTKTELSSWRELKDDLKKMLRKDIPSPKKEFELK